jgi:hypothetical protein
VALRLFDVEPSSYRPHPLHAADRAYPEANCYIDVFVELLHARGDEPLAALGCASSLDFEGDQLTFYKPPPAELRLLYGVDVHEMQPYRSLPEQAVAQLAMGRTLVIEVDAWYLPDTRATSYRREHTKTSLAVQEIDVEAERLHYFHGSGLHELSGEDFRGALRVDAPPESLLPYVDLVRFDRGQSLTGDALPEAAVVLLRGHLADRPPVDPFTASAEFLDVAVRELSGGAPGADHQLAFATARMGGSAAEIVGAQAAWLFGSRASVAQDALGRVVEGCKVLSFRIARKRAFDTAAVLAPTATAWTEAMERLDELAG